MTGDNDDNGPSESPLDDLFVEGARFREPSAAERAAWAKEQRKQVAKSKRRRQREHDRTSPSGRRPLIAIAVLFVLAFVIFYVFNPGGGGGGGGTKNPPATSSSVPAPTTSTSIPPTTTSTPSITPP